MGEADIKRVETAVADLDKKFDEFFTQYELDMRGDMNSSNGSKGVIGEIRQMKQHQRDYPSITWLLKTRPIKTVGFILVAVLFILALHDVGLLRFLTAYLGVPIP